MGPRGEQWRREVFTGETNQSLDDKGRLILPVRFRPQLERLWVFKGRSHTVYIMPPDEYDLISDRLKAEGAKARDLQLTIWGSAVDQTLDKQGRFSIPESLRRYAGLTKEVTVVGAGPRVEVWDREKWEAQAAQRDTTYAEFGDANTDLPI